MMENNRHHVIVGCGALGLFFAWQLSKKIHPNHIYLFSRSPHQTPIYVEHAGKQEAFFSNVHTCTHDLKLLLNSASINEFNIYICLPPDTIDDFSSMLSNFIPKHGNFSIYFLNNGILNKKIIPKFIEKGNINIIRAIVLSGFMRIKNKTETLIKHTSGNKIYYFPYFKENQEKSTLDISNSFFDWELYPNIYTLEISKFFVNLCLFLYLTPSFSKNGDIWTVTTREQLQLCAIHYTSITKNLPNQEFDLDENKLEDFYYKTLEKTVMLTKENTNSLTLAWSHGDYSSPRYFLKTLKSWLDTTKNLEANLFFKKLIDNIEGEKI